MQRILLCVDGESHTEKALRHALLLTGALSTNLTALHVVDPYLEKYTHEIYAVGRNECRAHLDQSLRKEGLAALADFAEKAAAAGVAAATELADGDRAEVIVARAPNFDLVVIGGSVLEGWYQRFESRNLPEQLFRRLATPLLIVR
jgi:nucleotide-binding universal stress UspA family protein